MMDIFPPWTLPVNVEDTRIKEEVPEELISKGGKMTGSDVNLDTKQDVPYKQSQTSLNPIALTSSR